MPSLGGAGAPGSFPFGSFPLRPAALVFAFALGLGTIAGAVLMRPRLAPTLTTVAPIGASRAAPQSPAQGLSYPAEVVRVIDGDTFEARVRVWPGLDVDTKVRLRGIDAAELHARCSSELVQAQAARTALEAMLAAGGVMLSRVGIDKFGGRVDASVSTRGTADVSAALLAQGFARSYGGGKRGGWCG